MNQFHFLAVVIFIKQKTIAVIRFKAKSLQLLEFIFKGDIIIKSVSLEFLPLG